MLQYLYNPVDGGGPLEHAGHSRGTDSEKESDWQTSFSQGISHPNPSHSTDVCLPVCVCVEYIWWCPGVSLSVGVEVCACLHTDLSISLNFHLHVFLYVYDKARSFPS